MVTPHSLADAVTEWLDGYYSGSGRTRKSFADVVEGRLLPFLESKGARLTTDVSPAMLTAFMRAEAERPRKTSRRDGDRGDRLSSATLEGYHSYLATFWNWSESMDYVARTPMRSVKKPVQVRPIREGFQREEITRLLTWISYKDDPVVAARDRAILLLFLSSGCRAREIVELKWKDIDWGNRRFKVFGKGSKERMARIGPKALPALKAWREARKKWIPGEPRPSDPVWITLRRTPMGYTTMWKMMRNLADYAGVEGANLHRLRHTAASEMYEETTSLKAAQNFLGHSKPATTDRYLRRIGTDLERMDYRTPDAWLAT